MGKRLDIQWPFGGLNKRRSYRQQAPYTTFEALNVRPFDAMERRLRGGDRPGVDRYYSGGSTDPVRLLAEINFVQPDGLAAWEDDFESILAAWGTLYELSATAIDWTEAGDDNDQVSGYSGITGAVKGVNTDADGKLYLWVFWWTDPTEIGVQLYKDAGLGALDQVGELSTPGGNYRMSTTGSKTLNQANGSGLGGTMTLDAIVGEDLDIVITADFASPIGPLLVDDSEGYILTGTPARRGQVLKDLSVDATQDYSIEMKVHQVRGVAATYVIYCRMDDATPRYYTSGCKVVMEFAADGTWSCDILTQPADATFNATGDDNRQRSGWLKVVVKADTISVFWRNRLVHNAQAIEAHAGTRVGVELLNTVAD